MRWDGEHCRIHATEGLAALQTLYLRGRPADAPATTVAPSSSCMAARVKAVKACASIAEASGTQPAAGTRAAEGVEQAWGQR